MRIVKLLTLLVILLIGAIYVKPTFAQQWCGGCVVGEPYEDPETGQILYVNGCDGCVATSCASGQYEAPDGNCYPVGSDGCECGEKADGSCKSCGGGFQCNLDYVVNCAGTKTTELVSSSDCINVLNLNNCGVGSSQSIGGCCSEYEDESGNDICKAKYVETYKCCPVGTTVSCVDEYKTIQFYRSWQDGSNHCGNLTYHVISVENNPNDCVSRDVDGDGEKERYCGRWYTCQSNTPISQCTCNSCTSTPPTGLTITQGESPTTAQLTWTPGTNGSSQRLYVDESQVEIGNNCITPNACEVDGAILDAGTNSYLVTNLQPGTQYYFRLTTYENQSCNPGTVRSYTTPEVSLAGRVYLDTNNDCSKTTPWNLGGLTVSVQGTGYAGSVGGDGRFGFYGGDSTPVNLVLSGYSADYIPSTATGCNAGSTLSSVANPSDTNYFYLTPRREAWWQVTGGSIYSAGNVRSELPLVSANLIEPGAGGALGALMRGAGSVDVGSGAVSSAGYSAQTRYRGKTMNYDYFAAHMGVTPSTQNYWGTNTITEPAVDQTTARDFYYLEPTGGNPAMVTGLTVSLGESYVIFVDGDLRIAGNIVVDPGGFLAFMVNGNMYVSPAVTGVQGLYVVDGSLITETTGVLDVPVDFEGSVVAWSGVNLGRDLVASNLTTPGESFTYRPDLLTNMPDKMKVFALKWTEVVPGTFGN